MRPRAELLIAIINDPNRVDKHYLTSRVPSYCLAINDFDLSLHCLDVKYNVYQRKLVVDQEQLTTRPQAELLTTQTELKNNI